MRSKVGIDLDSTLNCLNEKWLEVYNADYGDHLTVDDIKVWDLDTVVKPECGLKIYDYLKIPGFFYDLEVQEDSQEVTKWLQEEKNCELYVVTAYSPEVVMDKARWLTEYFPHIHRKNYVFLNDKSLFGGDYLIDDGGHNIVAYAESHPNGVALVYDTPYPWNHYLGDKYRRVHNWREIRRYFEENMK